MGWSIDIVRDELDRLFGNMKIRYKITHPGSEAPMVMIQYEGEIPIKIKNIIVNLFPESVYINFVPNSTFPTGQTIAETH